MRTIDPKFHIDGERIIKTSSGEALPEDEPLCLFRARDHLALPTLNHNRRLAELDGCTEYHLRMLGDRIATFERFAQEHPERMKQPGVTKGLPFTPSREAELASNLIAAAEARGYALGLEACRQMATARILTDPRKKFLSGWTSSIQELLDLLPDPPDAAAAINTIEARGAALAMEQVRRMAEALAAREDGYADQIISPIHVSQKHRFGGSLIRELLASLSASPDFAEEKE